jgi:hypothetical protein
MTDTPASDAFMRVTRNLQAGDIDFENSPGDSDDLSNVDWEKLIAEKPLLEANSVSSRITYTPPYGGETQSTDMHKIVIDLDIDAALWGTSTPGHHHLIIDHAMTWKDYERLLLALNTARLIEDGYLRACLARKASWIRTPWTRKG